MIPPKIDKIFRDIFKSHVPELNKNDSDEIVMFKKILDQEEDPCSLENWLKENKRTIKSKKGTYSKAIVRYLPIGKKEKFPVIIKISREQLKNEVLNEVKALKLINKIGSDLFVDLYAHLKCRVPKDGTYYFEFLEKLETNFIDILRQPKKSISFWYPILKQIFESLMLLEKNKILHNDFHFGNIMLVHKDKINIKIIDFSAAVFHDSFPIKVTTFFGTPLKKFEAGEDLFNFMDIITLPKAQNVFSNKFPQEIKDLAKFITGYFEKTGRMITATDIWKMYGSNNQ